MLRFRNFNPLRIVCTFLGADRRSSIPDGCRHPSHQAVRTPKDRLAENTRPRHESARPSLGRPSRGHPRRWRRTIPSGSARTASCELGEGGMGSSTWPSSATRDRRVALKIIKPGMDTEAVVARFEAERQALALMDHPDIAKVFDAGPTRDGRPYFVMELVAACRSPSTATATAWPSRERLELFIEVCDAVQHAHQKGVIHRDLKPSNILVALAGRRAACRRSSTSASPRRSTQPAHRADARAPSTASSSARPST